MAPSALHCGLLFLALLLVGATPMPLRAADVSTSSLSDPRPADLTTAAIDRRIRDIEASKEIEAGTRAKAVEVLRSVRGDLERIDALRRQAAEYRKALTDGASRIGALERTIARMKTDLDSPVDVIPQASLDTDDLDQVAAKAQAELLELKTHLASLDQVLADRAGRPGEAMQEMGDAQAAMADIEKQLAAPGNEASSVLGEARRAALRASLLLKQTELATLREEVSSQPVLLRLAQLDRDQARLEAARAERVAKGLGELVSKRRIADAEAAQAQTERVLKESLTKPPFVQELARENSVLGADLARLTADVDRTKTQRDAFRERAANIETREASLRQRLNQDNLSEALARILINERNQLPERADFRQWEAERGRKGADLTAKVFQLDQREGPFRETAGTLEALKASLGKTLPAAEIDQVAAEAWPLIKERRILVDKVGAEQKRLLTLLDETDVAERRMLRAADSFRAYLSSVLFWVPVSRYGVDWFRELVLATSAFVSPANWESVVSTLWDELGDQWPNALLWVAVVAFLWTRRGALVDILKSIAGKAGVLGEHQMLLTFKALALSALIALPWPLLMVATGKLLIGGIAPPRFAQQVGFGLVASGVPLFFVLMLKSVCEPYGLGPAHFGWRQEATEWARRGIRWMVTLALPGAFLSATMGRYATEAERSSLGRLAFIFVLAVTTTVLVQMLRFDRPLMKGYFAARPDAWLTRLRYLWFPALILLFLAMLVLALGGYLYAAKSIFELVRDSFWLLLASVVAMHLLARWLVVERTRLALKAAESTPDTQVKIEGSAKRVEPRDIALIDSQTRQLLETVVGVGTLLGLYLVWRSSIPALSLLGDIPLWHYTVTVDGATTLAPVTLGSVIVALFVALLVVVAVRNIGSVLEILLQRLRLEPGAHYAISSTARYLIIGIGTVSIFSLLGFSWSKLQWLVAALGVGLGFGLQEIVANFVSGLIILYERPIRIGDTVTVGEVTGVVSDIQIRATTLTDYDRRDVLIPNKNFITQQVINWTLSDPTTRLLLTVGVAYGTDPENARFVILEAVKSCPKVLREPAPSVVFSTFNASSLDFEVRAFARHMDDRLPLRHDINAAIARALKDAGIEIPFPQQDVYIRSLPETAVSKSGEAPVSHGESPLDSVRTPEK